MSGITITFIALGLIFPVISLLTGMASRITQWRHKKNSSPLFVPFVGPLCLSGVIVAQDKLLWLIPIVWIADLGTVAFLCATPRLIAEWWTVSRFTQIRRLQGHNGNQMAVLTLHSTGQYLLKKTWQRLPGELGILALGEPGTFTPTKDGYRLVAHHGLRRTLRDEGSGTYVVEEEDVSQAAQPNHSLDHWHLKT